jgi:cyclopropane fatty-acyl-phospholipid synthase-like methyltransferase
MNGGYDQGYLSCPCFWGDTPGSLVLKLDQIIKYTSDLSVLDIGCGEGKNAIFFARKGAKVKAIDMSEAGLNNAIKSWPDNHLVNWLCADIRKTHFANDNYDVVVAYGLLHCLKNSEEIGREISKMQLATKAGGYNILCAFNDRHQDLSAHPGFFPTLMPHEFFKNAYSGWELIYISDQDLHETHPHNNIPHSHSLTRLIAQKY